MDQMKVLIRSREIIQPSSSTSQTLKTFKLSLLDQLAPAAYVPMIIYYAPTANDPDEIKTQERVDLLKKSLSKTLTEFYPLAGRVKQNLFIDCSDEGVDFIEARVNCPISNIIQKPEAELIDQLLPQKYHAPPPSISMESQVAVQINIFSCGGMAIGTSISHKFVDGITFTCFLNMWASMAKSSCKHFSPVFIGPHLFPAKDLFSQLPVLDIPQAKNITKRFVFDLVKIGSLRERVSGEHNNPPSLVEIVSAIIWKGAIEASRARKSSESNKSTSFLTQAVNLRAKMDPPLPYFAAGNLLWLAIAQAPSDSLEIQDLVSEVQNGFKKFDGEHARKIQGENGFLVLNETLKQIGELVSKDVDIYRFTSLRKFQLYEADFGWGKPVWVSSAGLAFKNVVVLIESRDGNRIEAWVTLDEQEMVIFERNQELLSFDSSIQNASLLLLNSHL